MKNILLVSVNTWDSMSEIPFMFKSGGCAQVDVLCPQNAWLKSNSYYDNWIEIKEEQRAVQQQIIDIAKDPECPYTRIMLIDDNVIKYMSECALSGDLFSKILPITKPENLELLASKAGFSRVCEKYNIATPKFKIFQEQVPLTEQVKDLQFPLILKEDLSWGGGGIHHCEDWTAFVEAINHKVITKKNLVIQEYIIGDDIGVEALFYKGLLVSYNCSEVLSYFGNKFSFTTRRKYYLDPRIETLLGYMGDCFGLMCFASIAYVYHSERDIYYLIEVDTRTNMWMPYSRFMPNDFAEGLQRINAHWPNLVPPKAKNLGKTVEIALFYRDVRRCFKKRDWKGFVRWFFNYQGYWRFIPLYDSKLFRHMLRVLWSDFIRKYSPKRTSILGKFFSSKTLKSTS